MATVVVRKFLSVFGAEVDDAGFKRAQDAIKETTDLLNGMSEQLRNVAIAAGIATGALVANSVAFSESSKEIERNSKLLAVSVEEYQELLAVFARFGLEGEDVADVFATLSDRVTEALNGAESFVEEFARIGIQVDELRGRSPVELFERFAQAVGESEDPVKTLATLSVTLGDDLGRRLGPALLEGADGLRRMRDEAQRTGLVLDADMIRSSAELNEELVATGQILEGFRRQAAVELSPALLDIVRDFREWTEVNRELIREDISGFVSGVGRGLRIVASSIEAVVDISNSLINFFAIDEELEGIDAAAAGTILVLGGLAAAIGAVTFGFAAMTAGAIAAFSAIGSTAAVVATAVGVLAAGFFAIPIAVALAQDEVETFLEGGDSLLGRLADWQGGVDKLRQSFLDLLGPLTTASRILVNTTFGGAAGTALEFGAASAGISNESIANGFFGRALEREQNQALGPLGFFADDAAAGAGPGLGPVANTTTNTFSGSPITINGVGISASEAEQLSTNISAAQLRDAQATFSGGPR